MMTKPKILLVEDDANLAFLLDEHLSSSELITTVCSNGERALDKLEIEKFNLCLLDVVLPDIDGISLAKRIRSKDKDLPIVFLTSRNLKSDMQSGYAVGCDDYVTKPFDADLLVLKIQAILKRCCEEKESQLEILKAGVYNLNKIERRLHVCDQAIKLSGKETDILAALFQNLGKPLSREKIMEMVWGRSDYFISKNLDVFMTRIRKILREHTDLVLETIHSFGYVLRSND